MSHSKKKYYFALVKSLLPSFLLLLFAAIVLTWFLEFRCFNNDFGKTWGFITKSYGAVFLFNSLIMFFLLAFIYAITFRPWLTICIVGILTTIIAYVNENKLASRMTPLLPEDLELATEVSSLTKFVDFGGLIILACSIVGIILLTKILSVATKRLITIPSYLKVGKNGGKKHFFLMRFCLAILICIAFLASTSFIIHNNGSKYQHIDFLDTTFTAWNQERNYRENGFLIGFLYNCGKFNTKKPPEYSKKYIDVISEKFSAAKTKNDHDRQSLVDVDYNIVIILNESFYDPAIISDFYQYSGGDITPNLHNIMKQYPHGQMYSLDYGGGTANIEFEALTGLTNYYTNTVPYTNLIPKAGQIPSIATWGKKNGYSTTAIHTYYGGMYKRNISLANEGFDTFITNQEIKNPKFEQGSEYQNDQTAYNEVLDVIDKNDQKQLVALITMQNHTPFHDELYDGVRDFKLLNPENYEDENAAKIETYFQLLHSSDKYLGEFIKKLDASREKTVVLFFGDHSPGVFQEVAENNIKLSRLTPYFIYNNFNLDLGSDLPITTPNCLANTLYNRLNVKKPTINYLLDKVCNERPILTETYYLDNGEPMQTEILNQYENVTYDILSGKKYWMDVASW